MASNTIKKYGNNLSAAAGVAQPGGTIVFDATGLVQAQMTFAIDTASIASSIAYYKGGVNYPNSVGVNLTSYKYHILSSKGEVSMITVDYMGIIGGSQTKAQITGVSNTSAQPIETHPKFYDLAGFPDDPNTWSNNCIFTKRTDPESGSVEYKFDGFGVAKSTDGFAGDVNIKAGVRQFLKPMQNVRGTIFFSGASGGGMAQGVGKTIPSWTELIPNTEITGALGGDYCLLTAVNCEPIGNPTSPVATKVTYDIMVSGDDPWDPDIYESGY